ncbi:hypothetical protein ACFX1T_021667 [Malus domestica]
MGDAVSACYEMERNGSPRPHKALLLMALQKQVPLLAALHLYNMMNHGCRLNEFLDGLFKANRFEEAYGIVREIEEIRMGLNLETYNTTLNGFSSGWNANEAMQLLGKMLKRSGNQMVGLNEAMVYPHKMKSEGICPNISTWNALVRCFFSSLGHLGPICILDNIVRKA